MRLAKFDLLLVMAVSLIAIAFIALLIYQSLSPVQGLPGARGSQLNNDTADQYGLNATQRTEAIAIANTQPDLIEAYNDPNRGDHSIESITQLGMDHRSGYLNSSDLYLKVSVKFGDSWAVGENRGIVVDMGTQKIMGWEQYFRSPGRPPYFETAVIPPGAYWYHILFGVYIIGQGEGVTHIVPHISFEPRDSIIYPIIVDQDNMYQFKNGTAYQPLSYMDFNTNVSSVIDGSRSIPSDWATNVSISTFLPSDWATNATFGDQSGGTYYIILKNSGSADVNVTYESGF